MDGEQLPPQAPPLAVEPPPIAVPRRPRVGGRRIARILMWSLPFLAGGAALFFWVSSGRYVETDNSYVKGDRVYIATELSGPIVEVAVKENQHVSRGQLLYRLDDTPYRLALAKLDESRMAAEVARQRIASLQEDLQRIEAQLAGDPKIKVDDHPKVKQMLAAREEALLHLRRTTIEAPMDGIVSKVLVPGSFAVMGVPSVAVV